MLKLRVATLDDLNFLVWIEVRDEGCTFTYMADWTDADWAAHRQRIAGYITDEDKLAFVYEDTDREGARVAGIMARFTSLDGDNPSWSIFKLLPGELFPADGRFCEVYQLWVDRRYRRRGLATSLKKRLEEESICRGVRAIYTNTESHNQHVVDLNLKLGYREVRRGPVWGGRVNMVSLLKNLPEKQTD